MRIPALILLLALMLVSCFDDDPATPADENDEPENPYSGSYALTSTFVSSDCLFPAPDPGAAIHLYVSGSELVVNTDVNGTWDSLATAGSASSSVRCIPLPPSYACTTCSWYEIEVDFFAQDSFTGTYRAFYDYRGDCGTSHDCVTVYEIAGQR
ncbi:MAG: hypothetical protein JW876_09170 [Candidatus Krumholzibacteriota bacterium]|nr:hypothetical protein [Candidatus Krumholzibacteriota bacterium]